MSDSVNIDAIALEITSNASQADASLNQLASSLSKLKGSLTNLGSASKNISKLGDALKNVSLVDTAKLNNISHSLMAMSSLNVKASGITTLTNSLTRLSKESKNFDPAVFDKISQSLQSFGQVSKTAADMGSFIKSVNSFIRSADKMQTAANNFPAIAIEIKELFDEIAGMDFSDNTVRMAEALAQITKNGVKAGDSLQDFGNKAKSSNIGVQLLKATLSAVGDTLKTIGKASLNGLKSLVSQFSSLGKQSSGVNSLTANVKTLLATVIGFRGITGIFNWLKEAVTEGSSLAEINHIAESVFGDDMIDQVTSWANSAMESFGIASTSAKQYAGVLTSMFQASNIGVKDSGKMAMDLVGLAGDLSAFYNIDTETAYNKIKSGMAGMVRPLRDLGIDLTTATLKEYALSQGITKSYTSMTQAEKIMLRYKYLMSQTSTQQGDFSRTSGSMANQLRILKAYAAEVTRQIGDGLVSALRHVVIWLNKVMKWVLKASQAFATFMQTLFGKNISGASGSVYDSSDLDDSSDYASDLADSAGDSADNLDDAADAAKKLKKELAVLPFDELNQLAKATESSTSSSGSGSGSSGSGTGLDSLGGAEDGLLDWAVDETETKLGKFEQYLSDWAERIKAKFNAKDWQGLGKVIADGINDGIDYLYNLFDPKKVSEKINPWIDAFVETFNSLVKNLHFETAGATIGRGITILINAFNKLFDPKTGIDFGQIGTQLANGLNGMVREIPWTDVGKAISNFFMSGWRVFEGFVSTINAKSIGNALRDAIGGAIENADFTVIGGSLGTAVTKMATIIKTAFSNKETWENLGNKIAAGINAFLETFSGRELAGAASAVVNAFKTAIKTAWNGINKEELKNDIKDFIVNLPWGDIGTAAAIVFLPKLIAGIGGVLISNALLKSTISSAVAKTLAGGVTTAGTSAEVTAAATSASSTVGGSITAGLAGTASTLIEGLKGNLFLLPLIQIYNHSKSTHEQLEQDIESLGLKVDETSTSTSQDMSEAASSVSGSEKSMSRDFNSAGSSASGMSAAVATAKKLMADDMSLMSANAEKMAQKHKENVGGTAVDSVKTFSSETKSNTASASADWENTNQKISSSADSLAKKVETKMAELAKVVGKAGNTAATNFTRNFNIDNIIGKAFSRQSLSNAKTTAYSAGVSIGESIANGIKSVKLPTPELYVSSYSAQTLDTGEYTYTYYVPNYSVGWYKKGGLFTDRSIVGIGEAGDEAVLPLENKKTMGMIADAISENANNGIGIDESTLTSAIARGYVQAMMSNQNNQPPISLYATLYTENNEVLARAVQLGNQSIDYRNNATSKFSY